MTVGKALSSTLRAVALLAVALCANATPETAIAFSPSSIPVGGTATLVIVVDDTGTGGFTGGAISATYDPNVVNTGNIFLDTCGGTTVANAGVNSMSSTNMLVGPLGSCQIHVQVTSSVGGTYPLTIGPGNPTASTGSNVGSASASLIVVAPTMVTNTNDSGAGSLRDALNTVNGSCLNGSSINFNIPGAGPHVISPLTALPAVTCYGTVIDGYTQPGSSRNTSFIGNGNNASIQIVLNGSACPGCDGLSFNTDGVQLYGLAIHSFPGVGIISSAGTSNSNYIHGNYIGTDAGGMNALGNGGWGIVVNSGYAVIGTGSPAENNVISNNVSGGISVNGASSAASIFGNQIGGKRDGSTGNGNGGHGIFFNDANYSTDQAGSNRVRSNGAAGIAVSAGTIQTVVVQDNESSGNVGLGIDFRNDGPTANDETAPNYDIDTVQNYPVITSVIQGGGNTVVSGYLKSVPNTTANAILYANSSANPLITEGERGIGNVDITTDAAGLGTFSVATAGTWDNVTAQITLKPCSDCSPRSSEYSPKVAASDPLIVTNTNNSGGGSLRDAIDFVNANCAAQTITFNIPGTGVHTIQSLGPLPAMTCTGAAIDGYTQPGAAANSLAVGDNAAILVQLDGLNETSNGLEIAAASVVIRGLSITGFSQAGILVSAPVGTPGIQVLGNFIGILPDGVTARANTYGVASLTGTGLSIGGTGSPAERNLISGNNTGIQLLSGDASVIQGNYIGTNAAGSGAVPNFYGIQVGTTGTRIRNNLISGQSIRDGAGIALAGATSTSITGNIIGLAADQVTALPNWNGITMNGSGFTGIGGRGASANIISANVINGIYAVSSPNATIEGNFIGTDATGTVARGNGTDGIIIDASSGSQVGGPGAGEGNVIAFNNQGVVVPSGTVLITGNSIFLNTNLGINLVSDGTFTVPANDSCDADTGGNDLANFPVLRTAVLSGGVLTLGGDFNGKPSTSFRIELFSSPSGQNASNRGGKTYLGAQTLAIDASCTNLSFSLPFTAAVSVGDEITVTAIDPQNNTSSFSNSVVVAAGALAPTISAIRPITTGAAGGGDIEIDGANLGSATVTIGGLPVPVVNSFATSLTVRAPALAPGSVPVVVTTPGGVATAGSLLTFVANDDIARDFSPGVNPSPRWTYGSEPSRGGAFTLYAGYSRPSVSSVDFWSNGAEPLLARNSTAGTVAPAGANPLPTLTIAMHPGPSGENSVARWTAPADGAYHVAGSFIGRDTAGTTTDVAVLKNNNALAPLFTANIVEYGLAHPFAFDVGMLKGETLEFTVGFGGNGYTSDTTGLDAVVSVAVPAPALSLDKTSLVFGATQAGTSSAPQVVRVTSTGTGDAHLVAPTTALPFTLTHNCPATLVMGAFCDVSVVFSPPLTSTGTLTGQLGIASDSASSPNLVQLSGTATAAAPPPAPVASLTPTTLSFASRTVSTTSPAQTVTLANTGNAPLAISSIAISGDFAYASTCGLSVAAGGSCTIDVTFTPLVAGVRTGSLTVTDNAAGSPHAVTLSGTGLSSAAAVMNVAPSVVVFNVQQVGSTSAPEIVTVSNSGTAPLTFGSIGVSGEFSIGTPPGASPPACPVTLAPGASCRIAIVFHPSGLNQRNGTLSIVTNAGTATLSVMGTGLVAEPPQLSMAASLDFGAQPVGVPSAGRAFEIRNVSPFVATLSDLVVTGDFSVSDTCLTIAVGASCSPLVTFQPSALGPRAGTLTVRTLRDANPYTVNLTGVGEENRRPALEVSPVRLGFGNTFLGQLVTRDVVVRNTGLAALTISGVSVSGDFFSDGGCVGSIVPGASCSMRVTFTPGIPGGRNGTMLITSNAPGSPHSVSLSGTGCVIPSLTAARLGVLLCGP